MAENNSLSSLLKPFGYYNYLVGIFSGIYLIFLNDWGTLSIGLIFLFSGYWLFKVSFFIPVLLNRTIEYVSGKEIEESSLIPALLTIFLRTFIILAWCYVVLIYLLGSNTNSLLPRLLFCYTVVTAPLNYLALNYFTVEEIRAENVTLLFDFMFAIGIFLILIMGLSIYNLVIITGVLVIFVRSFHFILNLNESKKKVESR